MAVKVLKTKRADGRQRFRREIELQRGELADVTGLLPVLDAAGDGEDPPWFAMPIAKPLSKALSDASLSELLAAFADIADVLSVLHRRGFAHRDVKPGNLYQYEGRSVVGDLGLVACRSRRRSRSGAERSGRDLSSHLRCSILRNTLPVPRHVYSLARTLWVLLTRGRFPPPGTHLQTVAALRASSYVQHPRVAFLDRLIERATAHERSDRPTAAEFASEVRLVIAGSTTPVRHYAGDVEMLRAELRLVAENSRRGDAQQESRADAGQQLLAALLRAGAERSPLSSVWELHWSARASPGAIASLNALTTG